MSMVNFKIPKPLYKRLEDASIETNLNVRQLIIHILRTEVAKYNAEEDNIDISSKEEEHIKKRLRELGYLD